jgi:hypothetical protein
MNPDSESKHRGGVTFRAPTFQQIFVRRCYLPRPIVLDKFPLLSSVGLENSHPRVVFPLLVGSLCYESVPEILEFEHPRFAFDDQSCAFADRDIIVAKDKRDLDVIGLDHHDALGHVTADADAELSARSARGVDERSRRDDRSVSFVCRRSTSHAGALLLTCFHWYDRSHVAPG